MKLPLLTINYSIYFPSLNSLKSANFPTLLLPVVADPSTVAGKLQKPFFGIPVGTPVGVALGDFQCSVLSSTSQPCDAGDMDKLNDPIT